MLTHVHKVIHKVVDTFTSSAGLDEEIEAKKVTRSDRTLALGAPTRPVSSGRGARKGAEQANAGCGTPVRLVHFCVAADAEDRT
jgi:hypothetical protein